MTLLRHHLPRLSAALLALFLLVMLTRGLGDTTRLVMAGAALMFACCWCSASHLLGAAAARHFVLIALPIGWLAEELGARYGWFFGSYTYTDVLGPRLGSVPLVIPLMWFALCYIGYVLANLLVWQTAADGATGIGRTLVLSLLAASIVTAYDLGADPYMVYSLKAWVMAKQDGWWFGETLQGFFGWMLVSFTIVLLFRLSLRRRGALPAPAVARRHALVPLAVYGGNMVFQVCLGTPVETRTIALFAMGMPLLAAVCGYARWRDAAEAAVTPAAAGVSMPKAA